MIYILAEKKNKNQYLYNLTKVFYPKESIEFIFKIEEYPKLGILLNSFSYKEENNMFAKTCFIMDDKELFSQIVDIDDIIIKEMDIEKKTNLALRKSLFLTLSKASGSSSPWGILSGIRPVKIVRDLREKEIDDDKIYRILREDYKIEKEKINLMIGIEKIQSKYIYPIDGNKYSLYISIPFCPTRCSYCSFPSLSISKHKSFVDKYVTSLIKEISAVADIMKGKTINSVYIGGGTPTSLSPMELERIIKAIYENFNRDDIVEFTVEAGRPDTISEEHLKTFKRNGISRISINPQTMNPDTLKMIGRNHSPEDITNVYNESKKHNFNSTNMDIIIGLPGEGVAEVKNTLNQIKVLDPDNLTLHTLAFKRGSKFKEDLVNHPEIDPTILKDILAEVLKYAGDMGLKPYYLYRQKQILGNLENIGFARSGKECIYNISMMEEKETIIGVGMGAVSKIYDANRDTITRIPNFKDLNQYINRIDEEISKKKKLVNIIK